MLRAETAALERAAYQQLLLIREKDLNHWINNYSTLGTQAALLAGFALTALTSIQHETKSFVEALFDLSAVLSLSALVHTVLTTTCITVFGPGLALRGPKGSMVRAVDGMIKEKDQIFISFGVGVVAFQAMGITTAWMVMDFWPAIISTVGTFIGTYVMYVYCMRIYERFKIPAASEYTDADWQSPSHLAGPQETSQKVDAYASSNSTHSAALAVAANSGPTHATPTPTTMPVEEENPKKWNPFNRRGAKSPEPPVEHEDENLEARVQITEIYMEGYMTKKGVSTLATWTRRYFVLQGQHLSYYKNRDEFASKAKAIKARPIDLEGYCVVADGDSSGQTAHPTSGSLSLSLRPIDEDDERRIWDLKCDTREEYVQWLKALRLVTTALSGHIDNARSVVNSS